MNATKKRQTANTVWIEVPAADIWPYLTTVEGWNGFLSDIAVIADGKESIELGDRLRLVIGELMVRSQCVEYRKHDCITYEENYAVILPNGQTWEYGLTTSFAFAESAEGMTKMSVTVDGYSEDEMMQWVRECGEMGWRQSLLHLKNVIELGLDLREAIFNYPRLGVLNYTATEAQLELHGLHRSGTAGNYIKTVYPNGPAYLAGLPSDVIVTEIGGRAVPNYRCFVEALGAFYGKVDDAEVVYNERGVRKQVTVRLTYDDQFTGMIDPTRVSREELSKDRMERSR